MGEFRSDAKFLMPVMTDTVLDSYEPPGNVGACSNGETRTHCGKSSTPANKPTINTAARHAHASGAARWEMP